jgi:HEAT repeat protein
MAGESAGALIEVLRSDDPKRRQAAARELTQFPADPAVVSALTESVGDWDKTVRAAALEAFDRIGEKTPLTTDPKPVAAALADESAQIRFMAARAVRHFGPAAALAVPSLVRNLREAVAGKRTGDAAEYAVALGMIAPNDGSFTEAMAVLVAALSSDDRAACSNAAWEIGALGPPRRQPSLL